MTEEQIQALRDELKGANDSIKALEGKNREVILKNKKLSTEYSEEKFNELLERNEVLENANLKLESDAKTSIRDLEITRNAKDAAYDNKGTEGYALQDENREKEGAQKPTRKK